MRNKGDTILVTGATGHLGNNLVRRLLAEGGRVRAFLLASENEAPLEGLGIEKAYGDISNYDDVSAAMKGIDLVFHLAGVISIMSHKEPLLEKVNVQGTAHVIKAAFESKVKRLVYASSVHAIVEPPHD